jgi:acyl-CoA thioester hydrolase
MQRFSRPITPAPADFDVLGHVNNTVWVRWMEELAVAHWEAAAPNGLRGALVWVVTRHEIDYRGNVGPGEDVLGETWIQDPPRGARFDRRFRFTGPGGRVLVEAVSTWAALDRASGRLVRVRAEIAAPFLGDDQG